MNYFKKNIGAVQGLGVVKRFDIVQRFDVVQRLSAVKILGAIFCLFFSTMPIFAQDYNVIEKGDLRYRQALLYNSDTIYAKVGSINVNAEWIKGSDYIYFKTYKVSNSQEYDYYILNAKTGKSRRVLSLPDSMNLYIGSFYSPNMLECRMKGKDYLLM